MWVYIWKAYEKNVSIGIGSASTQLKPKHLACMLPESESEVAQSCPNSLGPMDCSLSGSSIHGIFQARMLEWIAISFSRGSSWPRNQTLVSRIAGRRFTVWATREAKWSESLSHVQLFVTPWIVHGILQSRILEWVTVPFSRGSSQPRDRTQGSRTSGWFFFFFF